MDSVKRGLGVRKPWVDLTQEVDHGEVEALRYRALDVDYGDVASLGGSERRRSPYRGGRELRSAGGDHGLLRAGHGTFRLRVGGHGSGRCRLQPPGDLEGVCRVQPGAAAS